MPRVPIRSARDIDLANNQALRDIANKHESDIYKLRVQLAEIDETVKVRDEEIRRLKAKLEQSQRELSSWRQAGVALARVLDLELASGKG